MEKHFLSYFQRLKTEVLQSEDEGKASEDLRERVERVARISDEREREMAAAALLDQFQTLPPVKIILTLSPHILKKYSRKARERRKITRWM